MKRRSFLKKSAGAVISASAASSASLISDYSYSSKQSFENPDIVVVGSGVFGMWTAFYLNQLGANVMLIDAYGPGNSRSSSGGESRILRVDYGERLMYTRMALRAHELWLQWQEQWGRNFVYPTGRITFGAEDYKAVAEAVRNRLQPFGVDSEVLSVEEMRYRWPQVNYEGLEVGLHFPGGPGGSTLMAKEVCRITTEKFLENGGKLKIAVARPGNTSGRTLLDIALAEGDNIQATQFVFACGSWMAKLFSNVLGDHLNVYRRDVIFVGPAAGDDRYSYPNFPVWIFNNPEDRRYYGIPDIRGRGFKVAPWPDYNTIDTDLDERIINPIEIKRCREFVAKRFPGLTDQPIVEGRVCQLTMSSDEHFIVDRHPDYDNVWLAAGGSGHGFKHGPAFGEYFANRILGQSTNPELDDAFRLKV